MPELELENIEEEKSEKSSWIKTKPAELEKIVIDLAKQNNSPAKIGLILRDKYGIPKVKLLGQKITRILKKAKIDYITEKNIIEKRIVKIKAHIEKNKYDHTAKRASIKKLWHLHNINKYL